MIRRWKLTSALALLFAVLLAAPASAYGSGAYDRRDQVDYSPYGSSIQATVWNYANVPQDTIHAHCVIAVTGGTANTKIRQCRLNWYAADSTLLRSVARSQTTWHTGGTALDSPNIGYLWESCHNGSDPNTDYFLGHIEYSITFFDGGNVTGVNKAINTGRTYCNEIFSV